MNAVGPILIISIFIVGAIVLAWLSYLARQKRRQDMAALAARLGWSFDPESDSSMDDRFGQFGCFCRGHSRAAYNTLEGTTTIGGRQFPVRMGDYTYKITTSNGKSTSTRTYRFSYVVISVPWRGVPDLIIRREGLMDKLAGAIGFDDIDFESEEFSRRFFVKSPDKKFAYDVIHPRMMVVPAAGQPAAHRAPRREHLPDRRHARVGPGGVRAAGRVGGPLLRAVARASDVEPGSPVMIAQESLRTSGIGPMLILGGILGFLALCLLVGYCLTDRRRMQMRSLSMRIGWSFESGPGTKHSAGFDHFPYFVGTDGSGAAYTLAGWLRVGNHRFPAVMGDAKGSEDVPHSKPRPGNVHTVSYILVQMPVRGTRT
jgi:hypothetical protein